MKKKLVMCMLVETLLCVMLAGCGGSAEKTSAETVEVVTAEAGSELETTAAAETADVTENPQESTVETEEEETVETETETEEEEPEQTDWLAEHGIEITPQGSCQVTLCGCDENYNPTDDFDAAVDVAISETTEGVEKGFKKVSAVFTIDWSASTSSGEYNWVSAFDRYTGTSFEFDTGTTYAKDGEHTAKEGFVAIQNGEEYYDVSIEFASDGQGRLMYRTVTVTCPEDYDGTVFQIGYSSPELAEGFESSVDLSSRLYTIDEFPYYGDGYYYFTMTDE